MTRQKGFKHSKETKRKIGLANAISLKGNKQSQETIEKRASKLRGKKRPKFSKEWRENMRKSHIGKIHSGSFKKGHKLSVGNKGGFKKGDKPWNYIDGRSKWMAPARYGDDWDKIRYLVYLRDKFTCQDCGINKQRLDVHHKIPFLISFDNSLKNLIALCKSCHGKEESRIMKELKNQKVEVRNFAKL